MRLASWLWALPCASLYSCPVSRGTTFTAPLGLRGAREGLETPALHAHSRPHAFRLQRRPSSRTPSQPPSRPGAGRQVRVRVCSPPPQSRVHSPHRDHSFQPPVETSGGGPRGQGPGSGLPGGEEPQGRAEHDSETSLGLLEHSPCSEDPPGSVRMGTPMWVPC